MNKYLITYDLNDYDKFYSKLKTAINKYPCTEICKSSWAISTDKSADQICNEMRAVIDDNDYLFVCRLTEIAAFIPQERIDWLNK